MSKKQKKLPLLRKLPAKTRIKISFIAGVALVLLSSELVVTFANSILVRYNVLTKENVFSYTIMLGALSLMIGLLLSWLFSKFILKPVNTLVDGLSKLSQGEYSTRIETQNPDSSSSVFKSFNDLAEELEKTEILRSDFVNSFSHEFKTPINSINGLITLIKKENVSPEKRNEYLDIIAEEASRLSVMTTNILNISKYENQGILTDKTQFNLSEQIRTCILLLEKKWSQKNLNLKLDFDEYFYFGNDDMLRQVWINLIDNAIKFSDSDGDLIVRITKQQNGFYIDIENFGPEINEDDRVRIFNKFYQTDRSHAKSGNGIGLSIVKSIVDLHCGNVSVNCKDGKTTFTVFLPA
jgi:signal transduction histidine kinase